MKEYRIKILKALFVATILFLLNILVCATNRISCSSGCLEFRNEVITISDVKNDECFDDVVPSEISDLREILKPLELTNETPRLLQETKQYEIIAKVKSYFKYQNGCYKLILYQPDDTISYISAIIINPSCLQNKYGKYYDKIKETYINFNTYTKAQFKDKKVYYRISGAGFYSNETPINRYGLDNGFQLAPIFSFKKF
jgi:hypothetical protein